jgi:hypothetical protein
MFRDQITGKLSKPGEACNRIVLLKKTRTYTKWIKNEDGEMEQVVCSRGWEIVAECNATAEGLRIWNQQQLDNAKAAGYETVEAWEQAMLYGNEQ